MLVVETPLGSAAGEALAAWLLAIATNLAPFTLGTGMGSGNTLVTRAASFWAVRRSY